MFVYLAGEQGTPFSYGQGDLLFILYNNMQQSGQLKHFEQLVGKLLASTYCASSTHAAVNEARRHTAKLLFE